MPTKYQVSISLHPIFKLPPIYLFLQFLASLSGNISSEIQICWKTKMIGMEMW